MTSTEESKDVEFDYGDEFFTKSPQDTAESQNADPAQLTETNTSVESKEELNQNRIENKLPELEITDHEQDVVKSTGEKQSSINDITSEPGESPETEEPRVETNAESDGEVDEWDELQLDPKKSAENPENTTSPMEFKEALQFFENIDLNQYADKIRTAPKRSGISSVFHNIVGPPKLHKSLVPERNLIFTLALIPFQNDELVHVRILQTLYKSLSSRKFDCPRFGPHWELIGFQGNDPSTDLRGCGMLGLLTTLHFVTSSNTKTLASNIYQLSRHEIQNFPFCVMSINITRISLQVLRSGKINKECNQRLKQRQKSKQKYTNDIDLTVYDVFQELYESIFYKLYTVWKNEGKTMTESGFVIRDIETLAKQKPMDLLKNYRKRLSSEGSKKKNGGNQNEEKIESFVGIEDLR